MCVTSAILKGMNGITALIVAALLILLIAGWLQMASLYEQKALKKASVHFQIQRRRAREMAFQNRSFEAEEF
ncbi:MAG: hypothetical protein K6F03_01425 [Saccharofermentans sp.]|nr:hypothetical protein [Saccharofermentans sp.]